MKLRDNCFFHKSVFQEKSGPMHHVLFGLIKQLHEYFINNIKRFHKTKFKVFQFDTLLNALSMTTQVSSILRTFEFKSEQFNQSNIIHGCEKRPASINIRGLLIVWRMGIGMPGTIKRNTLQVPSRSIIGGSSTSVSNICGTYDFLDMNNSSNCRCSP